MAKMTKSELEATVAIQDAELQDRYKIACELALEKERLLHELMIALSYVPKRVTPHPIMFIGRRDIVHTYVRENGLHGVVPVATPRGVRFAAY